MPRFCAARGLGISTSCPLMRISPSSFWYTPPSTFMRVDLPAPFSPIKACTSPASSSNLQSFRARTPGKDLLRCWMDTSAVTDQPLRWITCPGRHAHVGRQRPPGHDTGIVVETYSTMRVMSFAGPIGWSTPVIDSGFDAGNQNGKDVNRLTPVISPPLRIARPTRSISNTFRDQGLRVTMLRASSASSPIRFFGSSNSAKLRWPK